MSVQQSLQASNRLDGLVRQVRMFQGLTFVLTGAIVVGLFGGARQPPRPRVEKFDEITVGRINVAGPDGVRRYIISHELPKAPFAGRELERTVPPGMAGLIMLDPKGNEVGGYAASESHTMLSLDYRNYPLEAAGLVARLAPDGSQSAGMVLIQPPSGPLIDMDAVERGDEKTKAAKDGKPDLDDPDVKELLRFQAMQFARIAVFAEEKSATIGLQDSQGRQRLLLQVDENDNPAIILYDAEGKETARFPEAKN
ncbi:MAG: hypothetical protein ACK6DS_14860 [Planctomycetota bacterium]